MALWFAELSDIEYQDATEAVREHVRTSPFSPTIADIRRIVVEKRMEREHVMTPSEAWSRVYESLSGCGNMMSAKAVYSNMTPEIQQVLGGYQQLNEWALLEHPNFEAIGQRFRRAYETLMKQKQKKAQMGAVQADSARRLTSAVAAQLGDGRR